MELWIRSTARTNLLKARFLTIMEGKKFYKKRDWEHKGYTICNCTEVGYYEILGTYKTKERALEVLDEIDNIKCWKYLAELNYSAFIRSLENDYSDKEQQEILEMMNTYEMPEE